MALSVGTLIGQYEILSLLGKGGMGEVYRGRDLRLKRDVAIKTLPDEFAKNEDRLTRFQREAEVLAALNHANIASIYAVQEAAGSRFLILEMVEGDTQADLLGRQRICLSGGLDLKCFAMGQNKLSLTSGIFELRVRSNAGTTLARHNTNSAQVLFILLMTPGVFLNLQAIAKYPLLDVRPAMGTMLGIFLLPVAAQFLWFILKSASDGTRAWRAIYAVASLALVAAAVALFLNGGLDGSTPSDARATVTRKVVLKGRHTQYNLTVSSWRFGRSSENFNVTESVFNRAVVGKAIHLEIHAGYFGLPWRGRISVE